MTEIAQKSGSSKEDVAQKEDVARKPDSSKEEVAQNARSLKEVVAKHRVAVISAIVVVGLVTAGSAYIKPYAPAGANAQEQSPPQSQIERAGAELKSLFRAIKGQL